MSDLCEKVGANIDDIAKGMGLDKRIGNKFLHTGPGYGGSCFPKDTIALVKTANDSKSNISIVEETIKYNDFRKKLMVEKIRSSVDEISNKNIAVLGLSFKPETDDMRYSPSIDIINGLLNLKANIFAYDPAAIDEAKKNGSPGPLTEIIDGYYAEVQEMGGNRWDSSGLIARLKKKK